MRKFIFLATAILFLSTTFLPSCESSKKATANVMKFNLKKGKVYDYDMMWEMDQQIMQQESKMKITSGYSLEVIDDEDDIKTIKTTYNDIVMNMSMGGRNMVIDTKATAPTGDSDEAKMSGMMSKMMKAIVGKTFNMKVNAEGKVVEITGIDDIRKSINSSFQDMPDEVRLPLSTMIDQQLDHENMKKTFEQTFFIFPNRAIVAGDTWQKTIDIGGLIPMRFVNDYKVKGMDGEFVTLDVNTKITSNSPTFTLEGTQTGEMIVESKTGLVVNAEFVQDMETTTTGMITKTKGKGNIKGKAR